MSATTNHPRTRLRVPKWLKTTTLAVLVVANLGVLAVLWAVRTGEEVLASANTHEEVSAALDPSSGEVLTFLIVGSDSREGLDDLTYFGPSGGNRSDVIMLARLGDSGSEAQLLSIPRDLWVDIPGHGDDKINAAYALGGPSLIVQTIKENLQLEVNHYVEIDFVGFSDMIDELGGIEIEFSNPARDVKSGLDVDAGTQTLDGDMALAYARSRTYQELRNGSWVSVDANDIGRTQRQQTVIKAIVSELKNPSSIAEAGDIAGAMARHMTIDSGLATSSVASLFWDFRGILTGSIEGSTLPVDISTRGGQSVVIRREPEAAEMLAGFRAGQEISEGSLRLQVLNGNGIHGSAGDMSEFLEVRGFSVEDVGDAERKDYSETTVIVPQGSESGDQIVEALGFGVVQPGSVDNGYDAVVIVGADAS